MRLACNPKLVDCQATDAAPAFIWLSNSQKTGNTGDFAKKVQADTDAGMKAIQISIDANKEKIITSLLQSVTTVSI